MPRRTASAPNLVFHYAPMSSATRVHWALEELGVPYDKVRVDLGAGDQRKPGFVALNPNAKVPTLVVDGAPIFESLAILLYLGERFGVAKGLWPEADDAARAEALSWSVWGSVSLISAIYRHLNLSAPSIPAELRHPPAAEAALNEVKPLFRILDERLADRPYSLGDDFSLVDVANASITWWASSPLKMDLGPYPALADWTRRCTERPAMVTALGG